MIKSLMVLSTVAALSACGLVPAQAVYEEIRAQERAKAVGSGAAPASPLPPYDRYPKERSVLSPEKP